MMDCHNCKDNTCPFREIWNYPFNFSLEKSTDITTFMKDNIKCKKFIKKGTKSENL